MIPRLLHIVLALALLLAGGFWRFTDDIPKRVPVAPEPTQGLVILTGGAGRLEVGLDLLAKGLAERLLISGIGREVRRSELIALHPAHAELFSCCVDLGQAQDTVENAIEAEAWARNKEYQSLRLVTAGFHLPRSMIEFRRALPNARLEGHPVLTEKIRLDDWWRWPGTASLLINEYFKYLAALVRARFEG